MLNITLTIPDFNHITQNINWSSTSRDLIIALIFVLGLLIHIFVLKKDKFFSLLFSIYVGYIFILFFPFNLWLSHLSLEQLVLVKVGMFVLVVIIFAVIFSRARLFVSSLRGIVARLLQPVIFGILNTGLLLSLLSSLLPLSFTSQFSKISQSFLMNELARFIWITLPMVVISFYLKRKRGPGRPSLEY